LKKHIKTVLQIVLISFGLLIAVDQLVAFLIPSAIYPTHYDISDYQRMPKPYIQFAGKPSVLDHNKLGYRWVIDDNLKNTTMKIAFFGGSTGYGGDSPIPALLENYLNEKFGDNIKIANFSVVSSNHRQHIHNIIESNEIFKPDLIIFYGGYNETAQPAFYDPRPGYPYNFFYHIETKNWVKILIENSPTFYTLNRFGVKFDLFDFTPLSKLREEVQLYSEPWITDVHENYLQTFSYAEILSRAFTSPRCSSDAKFRAIYQPYQVPIALNSLDIRIRNSIKNLPYAYDISNLFSGRDDVYTDIVHVNNKGNEMLARKISDLLMNDASILACLQSAK